MVQKYCSTCDKVTKHAKDYDLGSHTGDYICDVCGAENYMPPNEKPEEKK